MERKLIELDNVSFSYNGEPVLEDVSFSVAERDFVCIVGPNGGGKTTLIRLILGLLRPNRGRVAVGGSAPSGQSHLLGYLPQLTSHDPSFPVSVLDTVLMGRLTPGILPRFVTARDRLAALAALEDVGLAGRAGSPFSELSGGQRRRALIARALCTEPEALVLDEPTAGLDPQAEHGIYDLLRRLNERLTILMVSHDLLFVTKSVSRVICVKRTVMVHQTGEITDRMVRELYGSEMRMVRHAHVGHDHGGES